MMRAFSRRLPALLVGALLAGGCTNALYFYETSKLSMTLEGRPDATQPLTGTIGAKAKTAVVVPPKADTEAGSMLSVFKTRKVEGFLGEVTLTSLLVTGDAATEVVNQQKTGAVAEALLARSIPSEEENVCKAIATARAGPNAQDFARLMTKAWRELTSSDLSALQEATGYGPTYDEKLHEATRSAFSQNTCPTR